MNCFLRIHATCTNTWLTVSVTAILLLPPATSFAAVPQKTDPQKTDRSTPESSVGPKPATDEAPATEKSLSDEQLSVSGRYSRFERMLSQMADVIGRDDPERADLLRRAISRSREQRVGDRVDRIVTLLKDQEFGTAVDEQKAVTESLRIILGLLQSEDRRSSMERERERLNDVLKNIRGLVEEERSARAAAQNSPSPSSAALPQQKVLKNTESLLENISRSDQEKSGEDQPGQEADSGAAPAPEKPTGASTEQENGAPLKKKSADGDPRNSDSPENSGDQDSSESDGSQKGQENSESKSQKSENKEEGSRNSSGGKPNKSDRQTPGRKQLEEAKKLMDDALNQLKQQQRDPALKTQEKSIEELLKAASSIEETLKQLREEEKEMLLASLEARLQRLLAVQIQIHSAVTELAATPKDEWLDRYFDRCRELAQQQSDQTSDCSMIAGLLREDGTSVSILMAVEDIESDMSTVAVSLRKSDVGSLTVTILTDIIESLKQLIETAQKEMEEMKSDENQQNPSQQNETKPPLVELIAEIKVLRSLQLRVNRRTAQLDQLVEAAADDERKAFLAQLSELAIRQHKLADSAREMAERMQENQ